MQEAKQAQTSTCETITKEPAQQETEKEKNSRIHPTTNHDRRRSNGGTDKQS